MSNSIRQIFEGIFAFGATCSIAYYTLCLWSAGRFVRQRKAVCGDTRPTLASPVSLLKPLRGTDPEMYESFRSHCLQDYGEYEIIFAVTAADDPAAPLVERLRAEFPQLPIRLLVCKEHLGTNTKVSNLAQMVRQARYEYLVVNDSDIRVESDYLSRVLAPLSDSNVGLVTCLYRGVATSTLGSRLESLGISTDFCPGVLVAQSVEGGIRFGLGSTLAFRRRDLAVLGGFESLVNYLADDYQLGSRIAALGKKVQLSSVVVETFLPAYNLPGFFDHQLRWARTVRDSRRWGYLGLGLTFGLPWALLALIFARGAGLAWGLLTAVTIARLSVAVVVGRWVLQDRRVMPLLWLLPLRDFSALLVWMVSFFGHTVTWRGQSFRLANGKLSRPDR